MTGVEPNKKVVQELVETLNAKLSVYDKILATQRYLSGDVRTFSSTQNMPLIGTLFYTGDNASGFVRYFFF